MAPGRLRRRSEAEGTAKGCVRQAKTRRKCPDFPERFKDFVRCKKARACTELAPFVSERCSPPRRCLSLRAEPAVLADLRIGDGMPAQIKAWIGGFPAARQAAMFARRVRNGRSRDVADPHLPRTRRGLAFTKCPFSLKLWSAPRALWRLLGGHFGLGGAESSSDTAAGLVRAGASPLKPAMGGSARRFEVATHALLRGSDTRRHQSPVKRHGISID